MNRIKIHDDQGNEIDVGSFRPSSHSAALDAAVKRMLGSADQYRSSVAGEVARVNYTPEGRRHMSQAHARKQLLGLAEHYRAARQQSAGELGIAEDRHSSAITRRVRADAVTMPVLVELAKQIASDPGLRLRLVELVRNDASPDFPDVERIEAAAVMPLALSGLTIEQRIQFRGFITPDETQGLKRAQEAHAYTSQLAAHLARGILDDSKLPVTELDPALVEAMAAESARPLNVPPPPAQMHVGGQPEPVAEE